MSPQEREVRLRIFDTCISVIAFAAIGFLLGTIFPRQIGMVLFFLFQICDFG